MADNEDPAAPLIVRSSRSATNFPQQGSIDWAAVGKNSVEFTVEALSRISKAGVEALTVYAARAIFLQVRMGPIGQQRIENAIGKLRAFPTMNKALWFGFGIKHLIHNLAESVEGLACVGLCACLTEEYSCMVSAKILQQLFLLYKPPSELTPALRQWGSLVEACQGAVTSTEFGLITSELASLYLRSQAPALHASSKPEDIAQVLKGIFDVSNGTLSRIYITGGADCAWLAAVTHWLLELSVEVQDGAGNVIYRPGSTKNTSSQESQVVLCYDDGTTRNVLVTQRSYFVPSGYKLVLGQADDLGDDLISHGRVQWSTCLKDTFGDPMRNLLSSRSALTGVCLGAAACILEHLTCPPGFDDAEDMPTWGAPNKPKCSSAYGRGFFLKAKDLLPELQQTPILIANMESMLGQSYRAASREYFESMLSLQRTCECRLCKRPDIIREGEHVSDSVSKRDLYCSVLLVEVICNLIRLMGHVVIPDGMDLRPTRSGLEKIYWDRRSRTVAIDQKDYDFISKGLIQSWPRNTVASQARSLFTGRGYRADHSGPDSQASAFSVDGLCFCSSCVLQISTDPDITGLVHVIPGRIQWNDFLYEQIQDYTERFRASLPEETSYSAKSVHKVSKLDRQRDSSSLDLQSRLCVDEPSGHYKALAANWHLSSKSAPGYTVIGPHRIANELLKAQLAGRCNCTSTGSEGLQGYSTYLVEGEGLLKGSHVASWKSEPLVRILGQNASAKWIALLQGSVQKPLQATRDTRHTYVRNILQGNYCSRCSVHQAARLCNGSDALYSIGVCILSSI